MLPDRKEAERFLRESEEIHPGPWADHCRTAAKCAEKIAQNCDGLDSEKAYFEEKMGKPLYDVIGVEEISLP